jgi:hypothetical protein
MNEDEYLRAQMRRMQNTGTPYTNVSIGGGTVTSNPYANTNPYRPQSASASSSKQYSLAEVQLVGGEMIGMMITAGPTLGQHLTKQMGTDGYLYLYNDNESLVLKADRIVAVKLTKMTTE